MDELARNLASIDTELEELAGERLQHDLLNAVCGGLEKLGEIGAADLFWLDRAGRDEGEAHVAQVRLRMDEFQQRLSVIEGDRGSLLDTIHSEERTGAYLADDILEAEYQQEQSKLEWSIEREMADEAARAPLMPWSHGGEDDQRFRRSLLVSLLVSVLLGLVLPLIDLPLPERWEVAAIPERLTKLIEDRPLPPPPVQEKRREEPKPELMEEAPLLAKEGTPEPANEQPPKKKVASKGILAFREKFSGLTKHDSIAQLGAQARISRDGEQAAGRPQRSLVTTQAPGSSGGINLASLSRDVGGGGGDIQGIEVARAVSSIGEGGGTDRPLSGGPGSARTDEEIQIVFDRHKSALYRLYNRELRRDPTLQGQMLLRLTIEADGSVSLCELKSSDMKAPQLSARVVERVRRFDFGAKEGIPAITILYPIDFLPAT